VAAGRRGRRVHMSMRAHSQSWALRGTRVARRRPSRARVQRARMQYAGGSVGRLGWACGTGHMRSDLSAAKCVERLGVAIRRPSGAIRRRSRDGRVPGRGGRVAQGAMSGVPRARRGSRTPNICTGPAAVCASVAEGCGGAMRGRWWEAAARSSPIARRQALPPQLGTGRARRSALPGRQPQSAHESERLTATASSS